MVEATICQCFPEEISFVNEKGQIMTQKVFNECKPIICGDCGGIGHSLEMYMQKKYELAMKKLKPKQIWIPKLKPSGGAQSAKVVQPVTAYFDPNPV